MTPSPAPGKPTPSKIIKRPYLLALLAFILANQFANRLLEDQDTSWIWLTASVIASVAMTYALWRGERDFMSGQDELQQKIRTEALAHAFPVALGVMMLLGRLGEAGMTLIPPHAYWIPATLPYFLILAWLKRRYR